MKRQWKLYGPALALALLGFSVLTRKSPDVIPDVRAANLTDHDREVCSLQSLKGPYGVVGHGTIVTQFPGFPPPPVLFAETGMVTFDGAGSFSGKVTVSLSGFIIQPAVSGTYSVEPDCSTSITVNAVGLVIHEDGVIIGRGKEFHVIQTDPGTVRTLFGKRL